MSASSISDDSDGTVPPPIAEPPTTRPRRRRFQFRLISLLVFIAVAAPLLAWIGSLVHLRNERNAVINYFQPTVHFGAGPMAKQTFGQWLVADVPDYPAMTVKVASEEDERRLADLQRMYPNCEIRVDRAP